MPSKKYSAPLFLLPSWNSSNEYRSGNHLEKFSLPSLAPEHLTSQLSTYNQFMEDEYQFWCREIAETPLIHRKQWEYVWILSAFKANNLLKTGTKALGFGSGTEPIPSVLAKYGLTVLASDAPLEVDLAQGWSSTKEYSKCIDDLYVPGILTKDMFLNNVRYMCIDMNAIPDSLKDFDVCWSACAFEHLGSIEMGLQFVKNSLNVLKPGGFAFHTTEFNLSSNDDTFESAGLSIYRKCDIERLADDLMSDGHDVWPINFHPGSSAIDEIVDLPPWSSPHLKLELFKYFCTSIGLIIRKKQL